MLDLYLIFPNTKEFTMSIRPIITSRLDNDLYAFTMGQLIWKHYPKVDVAYRFICRTAGLGLARLIDLAELNYELAAARDLAMTRQESAYLGTLGWFELAYLTCLADLELPLIEVKVKGDDLDLSYHGPWSAALFWETQVLAIIQELINRQRSIGIKEPLAQQGERRLRSKIRTLATHPDIAITEFGTRRRASFAWQKHALQELMAHAPNALSGTSNVKLAMDLGLRPSGTMAHQLFMVTTTLAQAECQSRPIAVSQEAVMRQFEDMYGGRHEGKLLIFLPDTYGTPTALGLIGSDQAARWAGIRQDSGDPFAIGKLVLDFYGRHGIDARDKTLVFSDGLDLPTILALQRSFVGRIKVGFGWGTNLTNDFGLPGVSMVIKPVTANGEPCAKLSDNLDKATGLPQTIRRLKAEAHYATDFHLAPVV